jgi:aspartate aminotransferase
MSIRLSQRLQRIRPSATVSITARAIELREQGRDVISLSAGEPDFDTPENIKAAAIAAIRAGDTKYTAVGGTRRLREAIATKLRRDNGLEYAPEQILVTSGAKQACFNACQAVLDTGDEAIIPAPYWVSYPDMVRLAAAEPVIVHTSAERGFRMTADELEAALTRQTRLLILNSPCNPTGAVYPRAELAKLGEILREHPRVVVLTDDIYEHIYWDATPFATIAAVCPALRERVITINGMSKSYAMSGWRVGYAAGPAEVIQAMLALQTQSTTSACTISQAAACEALTGDQAFIAQMCKRFKARHDTVLRGLNALPGVECVAGRGAFYLFPNIEAALETTGTESDVDFCAELLEQFGLALVPGTAFGAPGHLRISFAASESDLASALSRLERFISR